MRNHSFFQHPVNDGADFLESSHQQQHVARESRLAEVNPALYQIQRAKVGIHIGPILAKTPEMLSEFVREPAAGNDVPLELAQFERMDVVVHAVGGCVPVRPYGEEDSCRVADPGVLLETQDRTTFEGPRGAL